MTETNQLDQYATVQEAAERLSIHPESVRRLIRQGRLPASKFAHAWLVDRAVLEQFARHYDGRPGNKATLF
jgi:excisionase family DNA binding protein